MSIRDYVDRIIRDIEYAVPRYANPTAVWQDVIGNRIAGVIREAVEAAVAEERAQLKAGIENQVSYRQ